MKRSPFEELEAFFDRTAAPEWGWRQPAHGMAVDVADTDAEFVVTADLPGFEREDIDVTARDGVLLIRAERQTESDDDSRQFVRRERHTESVTRHIDLPAAVIEAEATASYQHGVLTVTLPKEYSDTEDGHRIDIE